MKTWQKVTFVFLGTFFGFILSRSGASDYNFIQGMFLLTNLQLYGIIGAAVVLTAPGLWLIKRNAAKKGQPLHIPPKPRHLGNIVGGIAFGIGWSMTGMCPGPIVVNLGEGKLYAIAAFCGTLLGAYIMGALYPKLKKVFGLPPIS